MKNFMIIKQRVQDFARFQAAFDGLKAMRERYGLHDLGQYRSADEANTVIVVPEIDDVGRAREYWHSAILAHGRERAGIVGPVEAGVDQVWLTDGTVAKM